MLAPVTVLIPGPTAPAAVRIPGSQLCVCALGMLLQLVATACLYLASKVQEAPKYLREVIRHAEAKKWSKWDREHPAERGRWDTQVSTAGSSSDTTRGLHAQHRRVDCSQLLWTQLSVLYRPAAAFSCNIRGGRQPGPAACFTLSRRMCSPCDFVCTPQHTLVTGFCGCLLLCFRLLSEYLRLPSACLPALVACGWQAYQEAMRDQVLVAERAVLYTIGFQLRIKVPYNDVLTLKQHVSKQHQSDIINIAWNLVNDRWGLDSGLDRGMSPLDMPSAGGHRQGTAHGESSADTGEGPKSKTPCTHLRCYCRCTQTARC